MILLIYFVILFLITLRYKSISSFLIFIQIISLTGSFVIGIDYAIDSFFTIFNLFITCIVLTLVILPWSKFKNINDIYFVDEVKLKRLTVFLLIVSSFVFVVFSITVFYVFSSGIDPNEFKYTEGVSEYFYYHMPVNIKLIILSQFLYNFSYFLIPLHFYYLSKQRFWLSLLCFIFSLNIILFGLTFFSRWTPVHYILIYVSFIIILKDTLTIKYKKFIKVVALAMGIILTTYFIDVTIQRFLEHKAYEALIPQESLIQDPVYYSYFDYLSQWYNNSMYLIDSYDFKTFKGQITFQPILSLFGQYGIINPIDYKDLRQSLWPNHSGSFNGLVAYSIYDYGYVVSILLAFFYYYIVRKLAPKDKRIPAINLFLLVLFIQFPLLAIFYSIAPALLFPMLFFIPIYFYLKSNLKIQRIQVSK